jgi:hypothetical protein
MRTTPKQRQLFLTRAVKLLLDLGAQQDGGEMYRFALPTKAGLLRLHPDDHQTEGLGTVFSRFDDPQAARQLVDCNPHSGKWNHHYFGGWTLHAALTDLSTQLRRVLI